MEIRPSYTMDWWPYPNMAVCQNLVPLVNIKIAGKWMFIPLKMVLIDIDPYPNMGKHWNRTGTPLDLIILGPIGQSQCYPNI